MLKNESRGNETLRMKVAQQRNPTAGYQPLPIWPPRIILVVKADPGIRGDQVNPGGER
jgi:hypothetical protein